MSTDRPMDPVVDFPGNWPPLDLNEWQDPDDVDLLAVLDVSGPGWCSRCGDYACECDL
jgi:hypothetical protein